MQTLTFISLAVTLLLIIYIQTTVEEKRVYDASMRTLSQIEHVLAENQRELDTIREKYRQTCIHNTETIARIIESDPDVMYDVAELRNIAETTEVDEIHLFDKTGRVFTGTHPEYYDYTFESGEQIGFFKPLLTDKSLQLVQDITPNTAEGKLMQYSALWSKSGEFIVQVGMEPRTVMRLTEKNKLSYIFSLFAVSPEASYYAIDVETGEIVGATVRGNIGKTADEIGVDISDIAPETRGFFAEINGQKSFCVFKAAGDTYIGRVVTARELYKRIPTMVIQFAACLAVVAVLLSYTTTRYMDRYVVGSIREINEKLHSIANGNLDETIGGYNSLEFSELSNYLNAMIKSLLDNNKKMSYVLSKTNRYIGVYEYNQYMKKVRFTEYVPYILSLDKEEEERLASDYSQFRAFIGEIRKNLVPDEDGVFRLNGETDRYVRLDEIEEPNRIFGVVMDVTNEIMQRRALEFERDIDLLTGLYNRRGVDNKLAALFKSPEALGHSAVVMLDADGLKTVNDTYGHEMGDFYLKNVAEIVKNFSVRESVAARQSGDEFILFLYQYGSEEELLNELKRLEFVQDRCTASLNGTVCVRLKFSFGYSLTRPGVPYQELIKEADKKMYENKRERKKVSISCT